MAIQQIYPFSRTLVTHEFADLLRFAIGHHADRLPRLPAYSSTRRIARTSIETTDLCQRDESLQSV